jgi:hypothetical protein
MTEQNGLAGTMEQKATKEILDQVVLTEHNGLAGTDGAKDKGDTGSAGADGANGLAGGHGGRQRRYWSISTEQMV